MATNKTTHTLPAEQMFEPDGTPVKLLFVMFVIFVVVLLTTVFAVWQFFEWRNQNRLDAVQNVENPTRAVLEAEGAAELSAWGFAGCPVEEAPAGASEGDSAEGGEAAAETDTEKEEKADDGKPACDPDEASYRMPIDQAIKALGASQDQSLLAPGPAPKQPAGGDGALQGAAGQPAAGQGAGAAGGIPQPQQLRRVNPRAIGGKPSIQGATRKLDPKTLPKRTNPARLKGAPTQGGR